jgi:hypothetical protein
VFTARYVLHSTFCPHSVFMCFVWIWEQTAIISLYSIDWLDFITETECVYCAVRSTFYVLPTRVFMCFVWIWEQTAIISLYSINWLVGWFLGAFAKLRKNDYLLRYVCLAVLPHGTTWLPLDGFSWNFILENFSKICIENWSFLKIEQE